MNNQGDFLTLPDNHFPTSPVGEAWETPCTFYHTWGYKSWVERPAYEEQLKKQVSLLSRVTSMGGNFLLNVGPLADGSILDYEAEVLKRIGAWMAINQEAIHGTKPLPQLNLPWGYASVRNEDLYLQVADWPADGRLALPGVDTKIETAEILGSPEARVEVEDGVLRVPAVAPASQVTVIRCRLAGALELSDPVALPHDGVVVVGPDHELGEGNYNSMQYNTNIPDTLKTWHVELPEDGEYQVTVEWRCDASKMPVTLVCNAQRLCAELGSDIRDQEEVVSDGNEEVCTEIESALQQKVIGTMSLAAGKAKLVMAKDADKVTPPEAPPFKKDEPWSHHPAWVFRRNKQARCSMHKLEVVSIKLEPA